MTTSKWSDDAFLDRLQLQGDELADATVAEIARKGDDAVVNHVFRLMRYNHQPLPPGTPPEIRTFFEQTDKLPPDTDMERLDRGTQAFMSVVFESGSIMLTRSLPAGYASPRLSKTLCISNDLGNAPYRRVLAVIQLLLDVAGGRGFEPGGKAVMAAQKMRLLHAGVRHVTLKPAWIPDFTEEMGGVPASQEDMLGTLMGFSYLVIDGLRRIIGIIDDREAEDFYYMWQVYGVMMGIHPPGEAGSFEYIPSNLDEAGEFYESYARRHYVAADQNPEGVYLAEADLRMMQTLLPVPLRWLGWNIIPRLLIEDMLGRPGMHRVDLKPVPLYPLLELVFLEIPFAIDRIVRRRESQHMHGQFAELILGDMVDHGAGGEITFGVPMSMPELEALADNHSRPCLER